MPKITKVISYKVVIEPSKNTDILFTNAKERLKIERELCAKIAEKIRKDFVEADLVYIKGEEEEVCKFCGANWNAKGDGGNYCCPQEIYEHERISVLHAREEDEETQVISARN